MNIITNLNYFMYYRIVITKFEDNPNYKAEYETYVTDRKYRNYNMMDANPDAEPSREIKKEALHTVLSEEQFNAVRKAALEQF